MRWRGSRAGDLATWAKATCEREAEPISVDATVGSFAKDPVFAAEYLRTALEDGETAKLQIVPKRIARTTVALGEASQLESQYLDGDYNLAYSTGLVFTADRERKAFFAPVTGAEN